MNILSKDKVEIKEYIADNLTIREISEKLSEELNTRITPDRVVYFLKKEGIAYKNRTTKRKPPANRNKYTPDDLCLHCGKHVLKLNVHLEKCDRKKFYDKILPHKHKIRELIELGYGINTMNKMLNIAVTPSAIRGFCKKENIRYSGKWDAKLQYSITHRENPSTRDDVKQKKEQTCMRKYGVRNVFQVPEIIEKSKKTKLERYGSLMPQRSKGRMSKIHQQVSGILSSANVKHINEHAKLLGEFDIPYRPIPDIYIEDFNLVLEVYSDFWHANPTIYNKTDVFNCFAGCLTAEQMWEKDAGRAKVFLDCGFNFEHIWESEISSEKINEILSNYSN